jgi:hypothetical protein
MSVSVFVSEHGLWIEEAESSKHYISGGEGSKHDEIGDDKMATEAYIQ